MWTRARRALLVAITMSALAATASAMDAHDQDQQCCEFVRASVAVQKELADKVRQLNGRRVYLFDATGFVADWQDERTPDGIRYKSGVLDDHLVDAVLSMSAQRTLSGAPGAQTYLGWTDKTGQAVDQHGVYIG